MPPRRRRKKRHALNPLAYLTPEVVKAIVLCAAAAVPGMAVSRKSGEQAETATAKADSAQTQTEYANANTNAALGALFVISARLDSVTARLNRLERREGGRAVRYGARFVDGPEVPPGWTYQPVKRKKFLGIF